MISHSKMVAMLPGDIRGRLRGCIDDATLRSFARMYVENAGDVCPEREMFAALDRWAELGFPEPTPEQPHCPFCGDKIPVASVDDGTGHPAVDDPEVRCERCDVVFGPTWATDPDKSVQLYGYGDIPGM